MEQTELRPVVKRARAGDRDAWGTLYESQYRRVLGLSRRLLGSQEDAEEATGEVFKVPRALDRYDSSLDFSPWLLSVARNHCIDRLRQRQVERQRFVGKDVASVPLRGHTASPFANLLSTELRQRVSREIDRLPENYRLPLVLRYFSEMSYEEIGSALDMKRNTVATLIHRAKQSLRRRLHPPEAHMVGAE
jgi:RNA polymerase sigma-70 factor (ECF subfamily)